MIKGIKLILIVLWMGLIFSFSMDTGDASANKSGSIVIQVGEFISHHKYSEKEKERILNIYETPLRKSAHFFVFLVLEFLLLWFFMEFHPLSAKDIIYSLLIVSLYAASDEIHQMFVLERSGEIRDVIIDVCGGISCVIFYYFFKNKKLVK